jgi:hypothetical protein
LLTFSSGKTVPYNKNDDISRRGKVRLVTKNRKRRP